MYNEENRLSGGSATVKRFCEGLDGNPIFTPLMSRVHKHITQAEELIFMDSSASFEDYNNPMFVLSASSAAGGLPLGVVITSGDIRGRIHTTDTIS